MNWIDAGDHVAYVLEPIATWAPESSDDRLYLFDIDDLDPGPGVPQQLFNGAPSDAPPV